MAKNKGFSVVKWLLALVIIGGAAGAGYWYWKHPGDKEPEFKTAAVARGDLIQLVTATGQLNPKTNVLVGSQVSGIISKLLVDFNSPVTNGEVIAQLDPATYKAIVDECRADLANSKASLELAQANEERESVLYTNKIVAQADYDAAVAALHQGQAQVLLKQATLEQAEVNLAYTTIYAPVDGVVISRNVDVGQTVAASLSAPTLFMIANDMSKMQIDSLVSEADIGGVETNQNVNFTVDAFPGRNFQGLVVQIRNAAQTNQNVITYDTVIGVDNADLKLRPGMTANVFIVTAQRTNVLTIPRGALRFHPMDLTEVKKGTNTLAAGNSGAPPGGSGPRGTQGGGGGPGNAGGGAGAHPRGERPSQTVYLLAKGPDGKENIAKPVKVRVGISDGISTQVLDGLQEGDEVIVGQSISAAQAQAASGNPFGGGGRRF